MEKGSYNKYDYRIQNLIDTPVYDDSQMQAILDGIVQNIWQKMDASGMNAMELASLSTVSMTSLSRVFNYKNPISLKSLIKIACALQASPVDFFPVDLNKRKTNGERFDEITRGMNVSSINYLLDVAAGFSRLCK